MKKIQTETQAKDAAKVTALVTKLNRYRHEYYNLAAPSVSVADVIAYASNLLLILRFSASRREKTSYLQSNETDVLHSGSAALP